LRIAPGTSSEEATRRIEAAVRALAATPAATVPVAA